MLGCERQRLREIELEVGGALAGNAVEEVERDVVEPSVAKKADGSPDVVGARPPLEHGQEMRLEALRPERHAAHAGRA